MQELIPDLEALVLILCPKCVDRLLDDLKNIIGFRYQWRIRSMSERRFMATVKNAIQVVLCDFDNELESEELGPHPKDPLKSQNNSSLK